MVGTHHLWDNDAMMAALAAPDEAFRQSEAKWGVDRLPRLCAETTLASYRKGWVRWRAAIETGDAKAASQIAPKMVAALAFMDKEATAAGHQPLSPETWETRLDGDRVLVIVRTVAEAHAVSRAARAVGDEAEQLPAALREIVEHQKAGRELLVYSLSEIANVLAGQLLINDIKRTWPGAVVTGGPITKEADVSDWARSDPERAVIEGVAA